MVVKLRVGERIWLRCEPGNPYSWNGIRVERENGEQVGALDRYLARKRAGPLGDIGGLSTGWVGMVLGGNASYACRGVRITFKLPGHIDKAPPVR